MCETLHSCLIEPIAVSTLVCVRPVDCVPVCVPAYLSVRLVFPVEN